MSLSLLVAWLESLLLLAMLNGCLAMVGGIGRWRCCEWCEWLKNWRVRALM